MTLETSTTLFTALEPELTVLLQIDNLQKGIDNYHIDIKLSKKFTADVRKLVPMLVSQIAVPKPKHWDNSSLFEKMRSSYLDVMTVLIHRAKTNLTADEICLFQFALIKHILLVVKAQLDQDIANVTSRLAEHRTKGSTEALSADQRLFWLKKNYDAILYNINKQIFTQLQRTEERQLEPVRLQYLGEKYQFTVEAMLNPLLYSTDPSALPLLLNEYSVWSWSAEGKDFIEINTQLEKLLGKRIKAAAIRPLKPEAEDCSTEIHDEMGGLFKTQPFLGLAYDNNTRLTETFSWLENTGSVEQLFNTSRHAAQLAKTRTESGFRAWWRERSELKQLNRTLTDFSTLLSKRKLLPQLLASHYIRRSLSPTLLENVDLKLVCQFLAGTIPAPKLQDNMGGGNKLTPEQMKALEGVKEKIKEQIGKAEHADSLRLLLDFVRYRRHLKLYRFAHRAFNRLSLRTSEEDLKLSKTAGSLYQLPTSAEIEEQDERICHHSILKADVRGSTTVTEELQNKGLNPASYFSMRFFKPINKILETYGAQKVFIEGDAIILSFLEHEHSPQQWFSVSRACGYARDMLKIVNSNNRYSTQMGLPLLELGVGICYADNAPRFLYDEDKPIMISGAIGLADRMSSCSWNLRSAVKKSLFNVDVLRIAQGDREQGEKGQDYVRYNVNGILIDEVGFAKLQQEISLQPLRMKLNGKDYLFHAGQYPDTSGRMKELIIREGKVGLWRDGQIQPDPNSNERYFEVVVNRKVIALVMESSASRSTANAN